jgi:hypothetical protein
MRPRHPSRLAVAGRQRDAQQRRNFFTAKHIVHSRIDAWSHIGPEDRLQFAARRSLQGLVGMLRNPPLEGRYVPKPDWFNASRPFGHELSDRWLMFQEAAVTLEAIMRLRRLQAVLMPCWFDCHAHRHDESGQPQQTEQLAFCATP